MRGITWLSNILPSAITAINYVEHAEKDFQEMLDHGCDTVILALTEFDMDFWFPNINAIIKRLMRWG